MGPTFGRPFRDRTIEELVKHEHGLDRNEGPSRRGCGCALVPLTMSHRGEGPMEEDPFEDWERTPERKSQEQLGSQKLAWYVAPFGDAGIALVAFAVAVNLLRRLGRQLIRIASRLKLV